MRKYLIIALALSVLLGVCQSAYAAGSTRTRFPQLPKTGQTTSYVDYDDGYYQKGSPISPRFVDNGDGTITDRVTNLMWVKQPELIIPGATGVHTSNQIQVAKGVWATETEYAKADLIYDDVGAKYYVCAVDHESGAVDFATDLAAHPTYWRETVWTASADNLTTPKTMLWSDTEGTPSAIVSCADLEYAGYSDWRLPNIKELMSIVDYEKVGPTIDDTFFPNTQSNFYWSSTTYASYTDVAWLVDFTNGYVGLTSKANAGYVRPVRGVI